MYGIDMSGWGSGLAGTAANVAGSLAPSFDFASSIAPTINTLPTDAIAGVAGSVVEEGTNAASNLLPNLAAPTTGLTASSAPTVANAMKQFGSYDPGYGGSTASWYDKGLDFLNTNSKGLEAGGKLVGGLAGMYSAMQGSKLAKEQLGMMKDNTAYNRARQAAGDKSLQEASDRVFGTRAV